MKKRKIERRMTLSKETVRILTQEDYREVNAAGGTGNRSFPYSGCLATAEGCCQPT